MEIVKRFSRPLRRSLRQCRFPYRPFMDKHKCIFVHVPKTAGTSLLLALGDSGTSRHHLPWHVYLSANPKKFNSYFKFSFVRNPWDRAWSAYSYLRSGGNKTTDLSVFELISQYENFDDFVVRGLGRGQFRSHLLFLPQSFYLVGPDGDIRVDFLGRVESFHSDYKSLCHSVGLKHDLCVTKANVSSAVETPFLSSLGADVLYELYREDVDLFGYSMEGSRIKMYS